MAIRKVVRKAVRAKKPPIPDPLIEGLRQVLGRPHLPITFEKGGGKITPPKIAGVRAAAARVVAEAGFRDEATLAEFSLGAVGAPLAQLTLRDADALHRASLAATYKYLDANTQWSEWFSKNGVAPYAVPGFFKPCRSHIEPFPWVLIDPIALEELRLRLRARAVVDVFGGRPFSPRQEPDPVPWYGPEERPFTSVAARPDVLDSRLLSTAALNPSVLERLGDQPLASVSESIAAAQVFAARDQGPKALAVLKALARSDESELNTVQRYQLRAISPAIAATMLSTSQPRLAMRAASAALTAAVPGTQAATVATRAYLRAARLEADRAHVAASLAHGPSLTVARDLRDSAYLDLVTGRAIEGAGGSLALQNATAILDLYRSAAVALHGREPMLFPHVVDVGMTGRTLPQDGAVWLMTGGGVASLVDPILKAQSLHAWRRLLAAHRRHLAYDCDPVPVPFDFNGVPLPGDLFRFDWLLAEVRHLAESVARIEDLLAAFLHIVVDQALAKIETVQPVTEELARLVDKLVKKVQALTGDIQNVLRDLINKVRDRVVLLGVLSALRAWPHDRWVALADAAFTALISGGSVTAAVRALVLSWLAGPIGGILTSAADQIRQTLTDLQARLNGRFLPDTLVQSFSAALAAAGVPDPGAAILQPLRDALASIDLNAIAAPLLADLTTTVIPGWAEVLVTAYVVAPIVVAFTSGLGALFIIVVGAEYLVSLILRGLGDAFGLAAELQAQIDTAMSRLTGLVDALTAALADVGALQGMLQGVSALLQGITGLLPNDVQQAVQDALITARDVVLDNAHEMARALERAFFRETLEIAGAVPETFSTTIPTTTGGLRGFNGLASSAKLAEVISAFETERIRRASGPQELVTQVLSLRQILPSPAELQGLLMGLPLHFAIPQSFLDRVAPGFHRSLIKDVALHVDFEVPPATLSALATISDSAGAVAGLLADPALDGRIPGGGFPYTPVVTGRIPAGLPITLTHLGRSRVRLKPSSTLAAVYDAAGAGTSPDALPAAVRGTKLLNDDDAEAHAAGWRMLEILDVEQTMMFSHFEVRADGLRFIHPNKLLKPFEHRGLAGAWELKIPAIALGSVVPQLPPIRDVRLVVSTVAQYDPSLASLLAQTPVTVSEPSITAAGPVLPVVGSLEDVVTEIRNLSAQLSAELQELVRSLESNVGSLVDVSQALQSQIIAQLAALTTATTAAGNVLRSIKLQVGELSGVPAILSGTSPATWTVDDAFMAGRGIDPAKVRGVVAAVVTPITNASLGGAVPAFPTTNTTLAFTPDGGSEVTQSFVLAPTSSVVSGSVLGVPASPTGTWQLTLPAGLPIGTTLATGVTDVLLGVLLEVAP